MLTARERQALLADMSDAWQQLNTALQLLGHATRNSPYGKGRRRRRSIDTMELLEQMDLE